MLPLSLCRLWQPDRAANAAQDSRSYTTAWGTIWAEVAATIKRARETSTDALKRRVDSSNWVEVPYLVTDTSATSEEEIEVLAEVIAQAWRARLRDCFPDRRFTVRIFDPAETGSVIGIGFEQDL